MGDAEEMEAEEMEAEDDVKDERDRLKEILADPSTSADVLDEITHHPNAYGWVLCAAVAKHPNTSVSTLRGLLQQAERQESVGLALARNPNTPPDVLAGLSTNREGWVRQNAAQRHETPVHVLQRMVYDPYVNAAVEAIKNPLTPLADVIRVMGIDERPKVIAAAEERLGGVLGLLGLDAQ